MVTPLDNVRITTMQKKMKRLQVVQPETISSECTCAYVAVWIFSILLQCRTILSFPSDKEPE